MITKTTGYQVGDKFYTTIEDAQKAELSKYFVFAEGTVNEVRGDDWTVDQIVDTIVRRKGEFIDILTTGPKSKPRARAINGAKRTRRTKNITGIAGENEANALGLK